ALMKIARQYGGAFLCDGVGLGKTFVGLMLIERLVLHESKRVVLFAPKATKEGVWEPHLRDWLPHIGGVGGNADFSNLAVFSHTDLGRKGDFPERFRRIAELADVVIIDEAHHFRNPGRKCGEADDVEPSRYYRLYDLLESPERTKALFMLTSTPMYYPLAWYKGSDKSIDPFEENRQKQVVGLIRTNFLKRFESSVVAFELSCDRLLQKLLAFLEVHSETTTEKRKVEHWKTENAET